MSYSLLLAILIGTTLVVVLTRRRARHLADGLQIPPDQRRPGRAVDAGLDGDLREVMIQLEGLARRVSAEIDTKYRKLEAVIRDADRRVEQLEGLLGGPGAAVGPSRLDVTVMDESIVESCGATARDLRLGGRMAIYTLADAGKTVNQIAHQLGRPAGEIELILAVRKERTANRA